MAENVMTTRAPAVLKIVKGEQDEREEKFEGEQDEREEKLE